MRGFLVRSLESYAALKELGYKEKCVLDASMYTWNDEAEAFWREEGVLKNTIPLELNEGELKHRDNRSSELLLYGYIPLMISAQCVRKNLFGCTGTAVSDAPAFPKGHHPSPGYLSCLLVIIHSAKLAPDSACHTGSPFCLCRGSGAVCSVSGFSFRCP